MLRLKTREQVWDVDESMNQRIGHKFLGQPLVEQVLEALACGVPMVCTSKAYEGLEIEQGPWLNVCDDPEDFARAVADSLAASKVDADMRHIRSVLQETRSWEKNIARLSDILDSIAAQYTE